MKRKFKKCITVLGLFCLALTGCGSGGNESSKPDTNTDTETTSKPYDFNNGIGRHTIAIAGSYIAAIKNDGTVITAGSNDFGQCEVDDWTDSKGRYIYLLNKDGYDQILGSGKKHNLEIPEAEWKSMPTVQATRYGTFGIKADGNVAFAKYNFARNLDENFLKQPTNWISVTQIALSEHDIFGLDSSERVRHSTRNPDGYNFDGRTDDRYHKIVASYEDIYGLTTDGDIRSTCRDNRFSSAVSTDFLDELNENFNERIYIADIEASDAYSPIAMILSKLANVIAEAETWTDLMVIDRTK